MSLRLPAIGQLASVMAQGSARGLFGLVLLAAHQRPMVLLLPPWKSRGMVWIRARARRRVRCL
jgi:hypothetical protein